MEHFGVFATFTSKTLAHCSTTKTLRPDSTIYSLYSFLYFLFSIFFSLFSFLYFLYSIFYILFSIFYFL
jgi:hypothetical protein